MRPQNGTKILAIKDVLLSQIKDGEYRPGDRLPSARRLAEMFDVSPVTATLALGELSKMGIVRAQTGAGTFVLRIPSRTRGPRVIGLACGHWLASKGYFHQTPQSPSLSCFYEGIALYSAGGKDVSVRLLKYHEHAMMEEGGELRTALESGELDGLLLLSACDPEEIKFIQHQGMPMVMCSSRARMWDVPWVMINYVSGFRQMASLLMSRGHARVRMLANAVAGRTKEDICSEFIAIAKAVGLTSFDADSIFMNDPAHPDRLSREAEYVRVVDELMATDPTAVVAIDEVAADFVIRHCTRNKLRIPDDLSLVALNDMTPTAHDMRLTSLNIQDAIIDMTYEALAQLDNVIEGHDVTMGTKITPSIIAGESLGTPKRRQGSRTRLTQ